MINNTRMEECENELFENFSKKSKFFRDVSTFFKCFIFTFIGVYLKLAASFALNSTYLSMCWFNVISHYPIYMNYSVSRLNGMQYSNPIHYNKRNPPYWVDNHANWPIKYSRRHYSTNNLRTCSGSIKILLISLSLVHPKISSHAKSNAHLSSFLFDFFKSNLTRIGTCHIIWYVVRDSHVQI